MKKILLFISIVTMSCFAFSQTFLRAYGWRGINYKQHFIDSTAFEKGILLKNPNSAGGQTLDSTFMADALSGGGGSDNQQISFTTSIPFNYTNTGVTLHTLTQNETFSINTTGAFTGAETYYEIQSNDTYTINTDVCTDIGDKYFSTDADTVNVLKFEYVNSRCLSQILDKYSTAIPPENDSVYLVILSGQSNAVGQPGDSTGMPDGWGGVAQTDIDIFFEGDYLTLDTNSGTFVAMNPVSNTKHPDYTDPANAFYDVVGWSVEQQVSHLLRDRLGARVMVIKSAFGGLNITYWDKEAEGSRWIELERYLRKAAQYFSDSSITPIVLPMAWLQGESDAAQLITVPYGNRLNTLIDNIQSIDPIYTDLEMLMFPIQTYTYGDSVDAINDRFDSLSVVRSDMHILETWDYMDNVKGGHYDSTSLLALGERWYDELISLNYVDDNKTPLAFPVLDNDVTPALTDVTWTLLRDATASGSDISATATAGGGRSTDTVLNSGVIMELEMLNKTEGSVFCFGITTSSTFVADYKDLDYNWFYVANSAYWQQAPTSANLSKPIIKYDKVRLKIENDSIKMQVKRNQHDGWYTLTSDLYAAGTYYLQAISASGSHTLRNVQIRKP